MKQSDHLSQIKEISDFIDAKEVNRLITYIDQNKNNPAKFRKGLEKDRWDSQCPELHDIREHLEINDILTKAYYGFVEESIKLYNLSDTYYPYAIWICILGPSCGLKAHQDPVGAEGINLSGVIYLNNDFSGGELYFTDLGYTYKPNPGSLIIFPSNYTHQINKVLSGYRYAIPLWATKSKEESRLILK